MCAGGLDSIDSKKNYVNLSKSLKVLILKKMLDLLFLLIYRLVKSLIGIPPIASSFVEKKKQIRNQGILH